MRILLLHLIFTLLGKLRTSPRVLVYLDNQNTALLQTSDLTVYDLDGFFNEVEFVVNLDFIQRYSKRFVRHAFLQIRDVKRTMNSTQLLRKFKSIGNGSYFRSDLKSCLVDDLWASELTIFDFSPTD
ncbi:hypothetical protein Tco_1560021, partial [Tanacetum coccineum]